MSTNHFTLSFSFAGRQVTAIVYPLFGEEANQYTIRPEDQALFSRYGSQTVHLYHGKEHSFGFPVKKEEQQAFWGAVGDALRREILPMRKQTPA